MYSVHWVAVDEAGFWDFDNDFAKNDVIFGVYNSSSSHIDNRKNNVLVTVTGERPTYDTNGSVGTTEKKLSINFSKAKKKLCLSFHYNSGHNFLFVNGKNL